MDSGLDSLAAVEFRNRLSNELQGCEVLGFWGSGLGVNLDDDDDDDGDDDGKDPHAPADIENITLFI